jgi:hypothetical protein
MSPFLREIGRPPAFFILALICAAVVVGVAWLVRSSPDDRGE